MKEVDGLRIGCVVIIESIGNARHECKNKQRSSYKFDDEFTFCPFCKTELVKKVDMSIQICIEDTSDLEDFLCRLRKKVSSLVEEEIKTYKP